MEGSTRLALDCPAPSLALPNGMSFGELGVVRVTFIDWSDAEGLFGLLVDLVADEKAQCQDDPERHRFLSGLLNQLRAVDTQHSDISASAIIENLREAHDSISHEFVADPVIVHLRDCIEELEKVVDGAADE